MAQAYISRRGGGKNKIPYITYTGSYIDYLIRYENEWYYELCIFSSGTLNSDTKIKVDACGIGGGGGGGAHVANAPGSGGGGSGYFGCVMDIEVSANAETTVIIGAGGAIGTDGAATTFLTLTCNGGEAGGADSTTIIVGDPKPHAAGAGGDGGSGASSGGDLGDGVNNGTITQGQAGVNGGNGSTTGTNTADAGQGAGIPFNKFNIPTMNIAATAKDAYTNSASHSSKSVGGQGGNGIDISGLLNDLITQQVITTSGYAGNGYGAGGSGSGNISGGNTAGYQGLLFIRTKI